MADITNQESVKFANERVRVAANKLNAAYKFGKEFLAEWAANPGMFPNTADAIVDGSATDGRHPITGIDANNIYNRLAELVTDYEADSSAKLNTVLGVATNDE